MGLFTGSSTGYHDGADDMNSYEMTRRFHEAFGLGAPKRPIEPSKKDRILRAKLMLEETLETIQKGLGVDVRLNFAGGKAVVLDYEDMIFTLARPYDPVETLDGIADVKVVSNGTGVLFGLPVDIADRLVFESNMSKLDENGKPIINQCRYDRINCGADNCIRKDHLIDPTQPAGKVLKSSRYKKVDLESLLQAVCDGHTGSEHDKGRCGKCGIHITELMP